jgi:GTP-binding protein Era
MIAGEKGDGVGDLVQAVRALMPQGPFLYPDDQATDQSNALLCAEITREHLIDRLHQELPYSMMVETTDIEVAENGSWRIAQTIIVARDGHKGMVIGKGGATLKQIGTAARHALREILGAPVRLDLRVVVDEKWDQRIERLRAGGLYRL